MNFFYDLHNITKSLAHKFLDLRDVKNGHLFMLIIIIVIGIISIDIPADWKIKKGDGDQFIYLELAKNLPFMIENGLLSEYYAHRILPSMLVSLCLKLLDFQLSDSNIIRGFYIYNMILLIGALSLYKRIANHFNLSTAGRWFGFCALFLSHQASVQTWRAPVMTDTTALYVGMILLLLYIKKRPIGICLVAIVGSFIWPVVGISGVILLIFLQQSLPQVTEKSTSCDLLQQGRTFVLMRRTWNIVAATSLIGLFILFFGENILEKYIPHYIGIRSMVTGIPSTAAVLIGLLMLMGSFSNIWKVIINFHTIEKRLFFIAFLVLIIPWLIVFSISNPNLPYVSGISSLLKVIITPPDGKILLPLVTHLVFWGPTVLFILFFWKSFCIEVRSLGLGFVGIIVLILPLGLTTEPRFITTGWPFFTLGAILVFEKLRFDSRFLMGFLFWTLFLAQFWLQFWLMHPLAGFIGEEFRAILVNFFRDHYGLWMSWEGYWVQLLITSICLFWMRSVVLRRMLVVSEVRMLT